MTAPKTATKATEPKGILQKILQIQKTIEVEKTGYDDRNDYYYFKAEDILNSVRDKLNELGIITRSRILSWKEDNFFDNNGRGRPRLNAEVEVVYIDVETKEEFATTVLATGSDIGGDKSPRKLATQAKKISLIDTFLITEESGKFDSDGDPEQEPINNSTQPEATQNVGASLNELQASVAKFINGWTDGDEKHEATHTGQQVNAIGTRHAKELGANEDPKVWRKDVNVLVKLVESLDKGEVE